MGVLLGQLMKRYREKAGLRLARASWLLGVTVRELREMESGDRWPEFETYIRVCNLYGWPK